MLKIVSGGQTGVDRGALDAALENGIACGGWCPEGRLAEDGPVPEKYPVTELAGAGYRERTRRNALDSDGTVLIYFGTPVGGTEETLRCCLNARHPYLLIDGLELEPARSAARMLAFIRGLAGETLNVAGPRHSTSEQAHEYAVKAVTEFIRLYRYHYF